MKEHLEAINHSDAVDYIMDLVINKVELSEKILKEIHSLVLRGIDKENAGRYRQLNVRISGSSHLPPAHFIVPEKMDQYFSFYQNNKNVLHPIVLAADMHEKLVTIHPFIDGNGRTSRLVMNLILLQKTDIPWLIFLEIKRIGCRIMTLWKQCKLEMEIICSIPSLVKQSKNPY